ncbi:MAG: acyltransferase [Gammaproteobacteria bacterium]|nr:MAG: acyltransferase [Gammaproteobacteria bacterium]
MTELLPDSPDTEASSRNKIPPEFYRTQHKLRLSYMPWLYFELKPVHREWAEDWQKNVQSYLTAVETVHVGKSCFIAPEAKLFAEPGRPIIIGDGSYIAADCVLHGPIKIGKNVSINHHVTMDGGRMGITIGDNSRIAANCQLYAFNHGNLPDTLICEQPIKSKGIAVGSDVWLGANVGVVDGVVISDHVIVGMSSQITRDVEAYKIIAGNPARIIGDRREKK